MSINNRFLHFVLKIGDFKESIKFFRDQLRMTVLRHEVFDEGCEAACNGPYDNKWSKTMIGYGPECDNFVLELTYNYSVGSYKLGNDFQYIKVALTPTTYDKVAASEMNKTDDGQMTLKSPDGYIFKIVKDGGVIKDQITEICLSSSDIERSTKYWKEVLQMSTISESKTESLQMYTNPAGQAVLRFRHIDEPIDHATAYGRMAFSTPTCRLSQIQAAQESLKLIVLKPLVKLATPGKADVEVVIIADPDGHEICFVGEEGFAELSQVDPKANELAEESIAEDKSQEWYEKRNKSKKEA